MHWQYEEGNTLNVLRSGKNHPAHTRASGGGRSFIFNPDGTISPQHAQHLVLGVGIPDCTLVNINSPNKAILASAHELRGGGSVALTLSSHPGYAIVPKFVPRRINEWHVSYAHWGIGPAADAATARLEGNHVISTQPATNDCILDVPFGKLNEGCDGIPVAMICFDNRSQNREPHNAARLFQVNSDGSISPSRAPHLALGLRQGDRLMPVANAPGLASFSVAAQSMSMPVVAAAARRGRSGGRGQPSDDSDGHCRGGLCRGGLCLGSLCASDARADHVVAPSGAQPGSIRQHEGHGGAGMRAARDRCAQERGLDGEGTGMSAGAHGQVGARSARSMCSAPRGQG